MSRLELEYWIRFWGIQNDVGSRKEMCWFGITELDFFSFAGVTSGNEWDMEAMLPIRLVKNQTNQDYTKIAKGQVSESSIPVVKSKTLYFNNDQKDSTPKKSCSDFPFTLGCVNTKIGDLNAVLFSGKRYDDMYNKQLEIFLENSGYFSNSNNELTIDTWNDLMKRNAIK